MKGTTKSQLGQAHFHANPDRADELRDIGPPLSSQGWAARVWPKLGAITFICGGPFATVLPKASDTCPFIVALDLNVHLGEIDHRADDRASFAWIRVVRISRRCSPSTGRSRDARPPKSRPR